MAQPVFVVLAGPNGSGKSTAASVLLGPSVRFVNADEVRRSCRAGLANFRGLYRPLADRWIVDDNRGEGEPNIIASGAGVAIAQVVDSGLWALFEERLATDGT